MAVSDVAVDEKYAATPRKAGATDDQMAGATDGNWRVDAGMGSDRPGGLLTLADGLRAARIADGLRHSARSHTPVEVA